MRNLFVVITVCSVLTGCGEDVESYYASYSELQAADAGARSWMPAWLPRSATDICDWHNLDTNATLIAFSVPQASPTLLVGCQPASSVKNPGEGSKWWPDDRAFAKLQHYECEERMTYADGRVEVRYAGAAIDPRRNRVYFWR